MIVDPESSQADKLRRLLNVVSGRAPDANGRVSEPLVKEELAIVEFLTAKTNIAPNSNSLPKETPVDLLLGLAKTRSGRRAAEEERRQLRQQAAREVQEQSAQAKGGMSSSPWGYKPPSMPGLDVQQPFSMSGQRREGPRPLQPPPTKRGNPQTSWSPDYNNSTGMAMPQQQQPSSQQQQQQQRFDPSPENLFPSPTQHPNFNLDSLTASTSSNNYQLSPYQNMLPLPSPQNGSLTLSGSDPFAAGSLEHFFADNISGGGGNQSGGPQFGNAMLDQFDFTNLGLDLENGPVDGGFNPFALPQTEEG